MLLIWLYTTDDTIYEDWWFKMEDSAALSAMLVTMVLTIWAGLKIRKWKVEELAPHGYRWNCKDEGLFVLFYFA